MRFSRHARNRARLTKITRETIETALKGAELAETDPKGNPIFEITITDRTIWAVIAQDDPSYIITLIEKRKR